MYSIYRKETSKFHQRMEWQTKNLQKIHPLIKAMKTLAKNFIKKINFFRTLKMHQRLVTIQGTFV